MRPILICGGRSETDFFAFSFRADRKTLDSATLSRRMCVFRPWCTQKRFERRLFQKKVGSQERDLGITYAFLPIKKSHRASVAIIFQRSCERESLNSWPSLLGSLFAPKRKKSGARREWRNQILHRLSRPSTLYSLFASRTAHKSCSLSPSSVAVIIAARPHSLMHATTRRVCYETKEAFCICTWHT